MRPDDRGIKHLRHLPASQRNPRKPRVPQPIEAFAHRVPLAEPPWQGTPPDVVGRKEIQRLKEQTVVLCLGSERREAGPESRQQGEPIIIIQLQSHGQYAISG